MQHGKALVIKAALVFPVLWIVLTLFNDVSFLDSTLIGLVLLLAAYAAGDLILLPKVGNVVSTLADFGVALLVIWGGLEIFSYNEMFIPALVAAAVVAAGEFLFHMWMLKNVYNNPNFSTHSGTPASKEKAEKTPSPEKTTTLDSKASRTKERNT
ncbi:DUF2512 family protein [Jeotgalibacillus proteolyticus]|uniref:DUF2512 family protein n=1 Tax=Jeotgalibacillus proteolyticus TaxID=2082395 RepID=UPI003CF2A1E9